MKVNKNFAKHEYVTDYYNPENPNIEVNQASIDQALKDQQQEFEKIRFKELAAQKAKLERKEQLRKEQQKEEVAALGEYCAKLGAIHRKYQDLLKELWSLIMLSLYLFMLSS